MRSLCIAAMLLAILAGSPATPSDESLGVVQNLLDSHRYQDVVDQGRPLLMQIEALHGRNSLEAAHAAQMLSLAMSFGKIGEKQERLELAIRAVEIRQELLGPRDPLLAIALYTLGQVHYQTRDYPNAATRFGEALAVAEDYYGPTANELHNYTREHGAALYMTAEYAHALAAFERQVTIIADGGLEESSLMIDALGNVVRAQYRLDQYQNAESTMGRIIDLLETQEVQDPIRLFRTLRSRSALLNMQGRFNEGLAVGRRALSMATEGTNIVQADRAALLSNLASTLIKIGDHDKALTYLAEAESLLVPASSFPDISFHIRLNQAMCHNGLGSPSTARRVLDAAREKVAGHITDQDPVWNAYHYYSGVVHQALGDLDRARASFSKALENLGGTDGKGDFNTAESLRELALVILEEGNAPEARTRLSEAAKMMEIATGRFHPEYVKVLDGLARATLLSGRNGQAANIALDAEAIRSNLVRSTVAGLPERQALAFAGQLRAGRNVAITTALHPDAGAALRLRTYDAIIRSRAVVLDEMSARHQLYRSGDEPEMNARFADLRSAKSRLSGLFLAGSGGDGEWYIQELNRLRNEVEAMETDLAGSLVSFRKRAARAEFNSASLQHALPPQAVCLSFLRYRPPNSTAGDHYLAIVQPGDSGTPLFLDLGSAGRIDDAVQHWRKALSASRAIDIHSREWEHDYRIEALKLRNLVWDPVSRYVKNARLLFIVPDGSLNLVSFASLPVGRDAYLVEQGPMFHYLTAESDLRNREAPAKGGFRGLLAMGDPAFGNRAGSAPSGRFEDPQSQLRGPEMACAGFENRSFAELPETRRETRAIRQLWKNNQADGKATLLLGRDATEAALKAMAGRQEVLHLATHGFFLGSDCTGDGTMRGIGGLSSRPDDRSQRSALPAVNPMLLSGLVLAGSSAGGKGSQTREDGIVTAEEVTTLDLEGVELAVLSACRTGSGTVSAGEGTFGLRRAFLIAGVGTIVTNLWDVEDQAGREWMLELYTARLNQHRDLPDSMRAASLAVLAARRESGQSSHPFFWGGWMASGAYQ